MAAALRAIAEKSGMKHLLNMTSPGGPYLLVMRNDWSYFGGFVLQLDPCSDATTGRLAGRIERVASMNSARIEPVEDLLRFLRTTLAESGSARSDSDGTE
jgi:hypothetical protein